MRVVAENYEQTDIQALNKMYYIPCTQIKDACAKTATNSDYKKVVSRAYSKANYSINPQKLFIYI